MEAVKSQPLLTNTQKFGNALDTAGKSVAGLGFVDASVGAIADLHQHFGPITNSSRTDCDSYLSYQLMQLSGIGAMAGGLLLCGLGKLAFKLGTPTEEQMELLMEKQAKELRESDSSTEDILLSNHNQRQAFIT